MTQVMPQQLVICLSLLSQHMVIRASLLFDKSLLMSLSQNFSHLLRSLSHNLSKNLMTLVCFSKVMPWKPLFMPPLKPLFVPLQDCLPTQVFSTHSSPSNAVK